MCFFNEKSMLFLLLRISILALLVTPTLQNNALVYLSQYGYLPPAIKNPNSEHIMDEETLTNAVREFQAFAGLDVTGELDNATLSTMMLPRCGVKDRVGHAVGRSKRYALQGSRWRVKDLYYKISKYPSGLSKADVDLEVKKAFSIWSDVTPLTFTKKNSGPVHIEVRFEKGEHGDGDPFDGPGGTLAHAFFPVYGGDAHFDDAEKWTVNTYRGTNLFQVAAHEFGHSLGLSHSDVRAALMAPFYRGYEPDFELHDDDVEAIQALYGKPSRGGGHRDSSGSASGNKPSTSSPDPEPEEKPSKEDPELCSGDVNVDTMFNSAIGDTYVFKGSHYWKLTKTAIADGYPRLISKSWPGLPSDINAAFTYKNGKTYFFKGKQYWRFNGKKMDGDYPKMISEGFSGIPNYLDAAMVWGGNGKIYFFKGKKFWRFDPTQKPPVKSTYPKDVSNWEGVPDDIDAALQYTNGYTYFFKKGQYYRFNDRTFSIDSASPTFPRPAGPWWFGCGDNKAGITGEGTHEDTRRLWPGTENDEEIADIVSNSVDPPERRMDERRRSDEGMRGGTSKMTSATFLVLLSILFAL